jgi:hypothetical protein
MYKMLDSIDKYKARVVKPAYKEFLHKLALERKLYESTILDSLNVIYDRSYRIIGQLSSQGVITTIHSWARGGLALLGQPFAVAFEVELTVGRIITNVFWSRESVWKSMANKVRLAIVNQKSFKQMIKEVQEMLKSSKLLNK